MTIPQELIDRARAVPIKSIAPSGLKRRGHEDVGPCPECGKGEDRFWINRSKNRWGNRCQCDPVESGDVIDLKKRIDGCSFNEAVERLNGGPAPKVNGHDRTEPTPKKVAVERYDYHDENGKLLFQVERVQYKKPDGSWVLSNIKPKKTFRQRRPDPNRPGEWIYNIDDVRRVPYKLPELISALNLCEEIFIVEGERKVDLLRSWGIPATCNAMGAENWHQDHAEYLRGVDAVILSDNDEAGRTFRHKVGASLVGVAMAVRVLDLPDLPQKGDIVDWAKAGGTKDKLLELVGTKAEPWAPDPSIKEDPSPGFSDDYLALAFTERHGGNLRYISRFSRWMHFDGKCWREDDTLAAYDMARKVCREISPKAVTSKTVIKNPPDVFIDVALQELDGALKFFKAVPDKFKEVKDPLLQKQFAEANGRVIEALEDYRRWLVSVRPTTDGQFSLGEENFRKKLRYEEMVEYSLPQLLAIGEDNLRNDQKALQDAALQIHPNVGAGVAVNKVTTELDKLAAEDVLPMAREQLLQLRKFISEHGLTPLPRETKPRVTETPEFAQAITEAAMDPPGPYETGASEADYWITPSDVDDIWELENTSIHEVFCGHFVQLMLMRSLPNLSMVRRLNGANSNTEGWALYCEQLMLDEGYGGGDSKSKLRRKVAQLKWALVRDVRWIAGVKLHTQGMSVEKAAELFEKEAHLPHETALKEARRGTLDPTYLYYTLGKLQIMKLRDEWIEKQGAQYSNPKGEFHRQLIEVGGTVPIEIIRREMTDGTGQLLSK